MTVECLAIDASGDRTTGFNEMALHHLTREGPSKRTFAFPADGITFSSRFDGGSLAHVDGINANDFRVTIPEDAAASGVSTGYTTWFYFEMVVKAVVPKEECPETQTDEKKTIKDHGIKTGTVRELTLTLTNMNNQRGLYMNGYTILHSVMDASKSEASEEDVESFFENERKWMRVATPIDVQKYTQIVKTKTQLRKNNTSNNETEDSEHDEAGGEGTRKTLTSKTETKMSITFTHHVQFAHERVRFAFCYPFTYTKIQRQLASIDAKARNVSWYYHRDIVTHSLGGLPIELLTISSKDAILDTQEPTLSLLYPVHGSERAHAFDLTKKRTVFITARVHPGETPANYMLDGLLRLLLHPTDERAEILRRHFVFKIIPVLNPDGVCQGFYRTDTRGVNLNRVYENPQLHEEPAVYATRQLLLNYVERYGSDCARDRVVYLDLHAHSNHRGCFMYGNSLVQPVTSKGRSRDWTRQVQTQLYAKLASLHSPFFDYAACSFDVENMTRRDARDNNNATTSRAGSSRVGLFHTTDLTYVYTIECNYNEGRRRLETSTKQGSRPKMETISGTNDRIERPVAPSGGRLFIKYSPAEWIDVGIGCLLALLDLFEVTPARTAGSSVVAASPYRTLDGVKKSILSDLKASELGKDLLPRNQQQPVVNGSTKALSTTKTSQPRSQTGAKTSTDRTTLSKY